ncbi:TlpA disulfide reductase family protein [Ferrimonas balearica]|uniref:TlpA disulfide reductase family protein n=1 Tax=Ferrimonas balearica TaxID=44012 RepID=UPI001C99B2FD|nr:TlpA disulfide reductase family protein [Ferrimonas balearica]MBY5994309.1 TlpA family protein disulfide reductase [Ferrimonas balearica]
MKVVVYLVMALLSGSAFAYPGATSVGQDPALERFIHLSKPQDLGSVTLVGPEGEPIALEQFKGQPVMINLWATWCPPCVRELPSLARFRDEFEARGLKVVPIAIDRDPQVVQPFLESLSLPEFETWYDSINAMGEIVPTDLVPATFILDEQGRLVAFVRSFVDWDNPAVRKVMEGYLPTAGEAQGQP